MPWSVKVDGCQASRCACAASSGVTCSAVTKLNPGGSAGSGRSRSSRRLNWVQKPLTPAACRSEEHTSELQSRLHLVCRLLLEKKKKNAHTHDDVDTDVQ